MKEVPGMTVECFFRGWNSFGFESHHPNIFSYFTNWKIYWKTLSTLMSGLYFMLCMRPCRDFVDVVIDHFSVASFVIWTPQNTWIVTINFCQNFFFIVMMKFNETWDYESWGKILCDNVVLGLPLGCLLYSQAIFSL